MATRKNKTQPDEPLPEHVAAAWQRVVDHIEGATLEYAPLKVLVRELAQSDAARHALPFTSHFFVILHAPEAQIRFPTDVLNLPRITVEYWPQASKFRVLFHHFQGVPFDQKWCELPEAMATLQQALPQLNAVEAEPSR